MCEALAAVAAGDDLSSSPSHTQRPPIPQDARRWGDPVAIVAPPEGPLEYIEWLSLAQLPFFCEQSPFISMR